jgi:hypothetical protein
MESTPTTGAGTTGAGGSALGGGSTCLRIVLLFLILMLVCGALALSLLVLRPNLIPLPWLPNLNAPPTISATIVLERIQQLSQLTTTRYNFSSVVTSEREMPPLLASLYGERLVMVAVGSVTAGVDLGQLQEGDIVRDGDTLVINLPAPTLQECFLDENASYIVSRDTGVFARNAPNLDTEARRFAVEQFRVQALERNVLTEAAVQAQTVVSQFASALSGVQTVRVNTAPPDPNAPLPASCQ